MVCVHLEMVLAPGLSIDDEELVDPDCALGEIVGLERGRERSVR